MSCPVRDPLDAKNDFLPENHKRPRHLFCPRSGDIMLKVHRLPEVYQLKTKENQAEAGGSPFRSFHRFLLLKTYWRS